MTSQTGRSTAYVDLRSVDHHGCAFFFLRAVGLPGLPGRCLGSQTDPCESFSAAYTTPSRLLDSSLFATYRDRVEEDTSFGRYRLVELLGRGGMGEVWRAHDSATNNRTVAIKLLPPHLATDAAFVQRFRHEAEAAAQLTNPHIIPIHNYGEIDGRLYVDMQLIEGRDLHDELGDGPLRADRAVHIIEQVAKALQAAHKAGLVHRDVKPSNILLDDDDHAYLIDFGIARGAEQTRMTQTGTTIGSWHYMAPERFRAGEVDARADVYALTCVLYECLTGTPPFPGDTLESQVAGHLTDPPPRPSAIRAEVPASFDEVVAKGMAKELDDRYTDARELASSTRAALDDPAMQKISSAPTGLWPSQTQNKRKSRPTRKTKRSVWVGGAIAAILALSVALVVGDQLLSGPSGAKALRPIAPGPNPNTSVGARARPRLRKELPTPPR